MGLRLLGAGEFLDIHDRYVLILLRVVHPLAMPSMIPYIVRPNSTRTAPPHLSPFSISDSSSLEAVIYPASAVIVEVW